MADAQSIARALSKEARLVVGAYLDLPCPYFTNQRQKLRHGLRARLGKGSPQEIADEAVLYGLREKVDFKSLPPALRKKFLVDHHLGVDCSGLAYQVLEAESKARGLGVLGGRLSFPFADSLFARLGRWLGRRAEHADVRTFAHPTNSHKVPFALAAPGDFFVRLKQGPEEYDHIILLTEVGPDKIVIVQSEARPSDGRYGHGVREEHLTAPPLLSLHRLNCFTIML